MNYWKRKQSKFEALMKTWNPDTDDVMVKKLPIFKGIVGREEICGSSLVDVEVYKKWSKGMWILTNFGYVRLNFSMRNRERLGKEYKDRASNEGILLHRVACGLEDEVFHVDHINHNKLDNRRCMLRVATGQQNSFNMRKFRGTSIYKGVIKRFNSPGCKPWEAKIQKDGKCIGLGRYLTEEDAARTYDEKAKELFGEFAWLNFPDG